MSTIPTQEPQALQRPRPGRMARRLALWTSTQLAVAEVKDLLPPLRHLVEEVLHYFFG